MTYSEFLDTLISPIQLFIDSLISVSNSLIHNYIFITFLGITLFISIFWLIVHLISDSVNNHIYDIEHKIDKYNEYCLYQDIQHEYLHRNRDKYQDYKYEKYQISQQVIMDYFYNNKGVLEQFKVDNLKLSKIVTLDYLQANEDLELSLDYRNYVLYRNTVYEYLITHFNDEVILRKKSSDINSAVKKYPYSSDYDYYLDHIQDFDNYHVNKESEKDY